MLQDLDWDAWDASLLYPPDASPLSTRVWDAWDAWDTFLGSAMGPSACCCLSINIISLLFPLLLSILFTISSSDVSSPICLSSPISVPCVPCVPFCLHEYVCLAHKRPMCPIPFFVLLGLLECL